MDLSQHLAGEIVDSGIDWLAFTVSHGDPQLNTLRGLWALQMDAEVMQYGEAIKTAPQGYHGTKTRHWFAGDRQDGAFFQVSSAPAREAAILARSAGVVARTTRIDYQATVRRKPQLRGSFAAVRDQLRAREQREGRNKRATTALHESDNGGDSVAIGAGTGKRSLIIYDKSAESRGALGPDLIRFELRCKQQQAKATWQQVIACPDDDALAVDLVADAMKRAGLPAPWHTNPDGARLPSSYEKTTEEKRIDWLINQVAPVVRKIHNPKARREIAEAMGFLAP